MTNFDFQPYQTTRTTISEEIRKTRLVEFVRDLIAFFMLTTIIVVVGFIFLPLF